MNNIVPFKGVFYNQDQVGQMKNVLIENVENSETEELSAIHFSHLMHGEGFEGRVYAQFCENQALVQDTKPAFYVHHRTFLNAEAQWVVQEGVFVARSLGAESLEQIRFCRSASTEGVQSSLDVIQETQCHIAPVVALYEDGERSVQSQFKQVVQTTPNFDFVLENGERHQIWRVTDAESFQFVNRMFEDKNLFVVEGAEQLKAAEKYRQLVMDRDGDLNEQAAYRFVMMYLCDVTDLRLAELDPSCESVEINLATLNVRIPHGLMLHSVGQSDLDGDIEAVAEIAA